MNYELILYSFEFLQFGKCRIERAIGTAWNESVGYPVGVFGVRVALIVAGHHPIGAIGEWHNLVLRTKTIVG